jgi:hypothetical protein
MTKGTPQSGSNEVYEAGRQTVQLVRSDLSRDECRLLWNESTYGRVFSMAALSHQAAHLEETVLAAERESGSALMSLLARHHWETWVTGMYLLLGGGRAFEEFAGAQRRTDEAMQREMDELRQRGLLNWTDYEPLAGLEEYERSNWNYRDVMTKLGNLGVEAGVFATAAEEMYTMVYRPLSGMNGAHPTMRLLDKYIDSMTTTFAKVSREPKLPAFRTDAVRFGVTLTCIHAGTLLDQLGADGVERYRAKLNRVVPAGLELSRDLI